MALDLRLETKMSQNLVMTPRLQQAIKLLQLNHMEMVAHVQEAMLENPTLEAVPDSEGGSLSDDERALQAEAERVQADDREATHGDEGSIDWEKLLSQMDEPRTRAPTGGTIHDELPPIETNLTYGESLAEHLAWQVHMTQCNEDEELASMAIIHNLDHRGYLQCEHRGSSPRSPASTSRSHRTRARDGPGLGPDSGCGARDLSECLIIQAAHHFPEDDNFPKILGDHLHNLERRNYQAISRDLGIDLEDVIEYHKMIQDLEPRPGRGFTTEEPRYITPDVYVVNHSGRVARHAQRRGHAGSADQQVLPQDPAGRGQVRQGVPARQAAWCRVPDQVHQQAPQAPSVG